MPKDTHKNTIHIALVDDHPIFREGMEATLAKEDNMQVVLSVNNGKEFLDELAKGGTQVDIVLLDLDMPIMDGFQTCEVLVAQYPAIKIIAISSHSQKIYITKILYLGAHGYLVKDAIPFDLIFYINQVSNNEVYLTPEMMKMVHDAFRKGILEDTPLTHRNIQLSDREGEVLLLICRARTNKEIANELTISIRTVERHRNRLFKKLGVQNAVGLVIAALQYDLVNMNLILKHQ